MYVDEVGLAFLVIRLINDSIGIGYNRLPAPVGLQLATTHSNQKEPERFLVFFCRIIISVEKVSSVNSQPAPGQ